MERATIDWQQQWRCISIGNAGGTGQRAVTACMLCKSGDGVTVVASVANNRRKNLNSNNQPAAAVEGIGHAGRVAVLQVVTVATTK